MPKVASRDTTAAKVIPLPTPHEANASDTSPGWSVGVPTQRNLRLPTTGNSLQYIDIFVDDFIGLGQDPSAGRVQKTLLHVIDNVFRPLSSKDSPFRREPVSMKKLRQGDCSWDTVKLILGWIVDTVNMTLELPPQSIVRLRKILDSILRT